MVFQIMVTYESTQKKSFLFSFYFSPFYIPLMFFRCGSHVKVGLPISSLWSFVGTLGNAADTLILVPNLCWLGWVSISDYYFLFFLYIKTFAKFTTKKNPPHTAWSLWWRINNFFFVACIAASMDQKQR